MLERLGALNAYHDLLKYRLFQLFQLFQLLGDRDWHRRVIRKLFVVFISDSLDGTSWRVLDEGECLRLFCF